MSAGEIIWLETNSYCVTFLHWNICAECENTYQFHKPNWAPIVAAHKSSISGVVQRREVDYLTLPFMLMFSACSASTRSLSALLSSALASYTKWTCMKKKTKKQTLTSDWRIVNVFQPVGRALPLGLFWAAARTNIIQSQTLSVDGISRERGLRRQRDQRFTEDGTRLACCSYATNWNCWTSSACCSSWSCVVSVHVLFLTK